MFFGTLLWNYRQFFGTTGNSLDLLKNYRMFSSVQSAFGSKHDFEPLIEVGCVTTTENTCDAQAISSALLLSITHACVHHLHSLCAWFSAL